MYYVEIINKLSQIQRVQCEPGGFIFTSDANIPVCFTMPGHAICKHRFKCPSPAAVILFENTHTKFATNINIIGIYAHHLPHIQHLCVITLLGLYGPLICLFFSSRSYIVNSKWFYGFASFVYVCSTHHIWSFLSLTLFLFANKTLSICG